MLKNNISKCIRSLVLYVSDGSPPIWSSGQPILLSWLLTESISLTRGTKMVSLIHCKRYKQIYFPPQIRFKWKCLEYIVL